MTRVVEFQSVSIVFGNNPQAALQWMDAGENRTQVAGRCGQVLGVHDCSLAVDEGQILVLMGLSGSGKSTLLRAVNALSPVVRGQVLVNDGEQMLNVTHADAKRLRALRQERVAMVFQQFGLLPWRSVHDNVGFGLELAGIPPRDRAERVERQLDLVGLGEWGARPVAELSGGMQQRVGLARALVTDAPILLMDEPFSALDPLIRARLQDELLELQGALKRTIIFVSHDLDEAFKLGDQIAIMDGGRVVQCGTPREIFSNPANDYVADFVAHMNPLGVLTAHDVMQAAEGQAGPVSVAGTDTVQVVMRKLLESRGTLSVCDAGRCVGSIRTEDILERLLNPSAGS